MRRTRAPSFAAPEPALKGTSAHRRHNRRRDARLLGFAFARVGTPASDGVAGDAR
jgi:hypothetical protein